MDPPLLEVKMGTLDPSFPPKFFFSSTTSVDLHVLVTNISETQYTFSTGTITVCPSLNITNRHVGGASILRNSTCDVILQDSTGIQLITSMRNNRYV